MAGRFITAKARQVESCRLTASTQPAMIRVGAGC
jgi:hypothetical protein